MVNRTYSISEAQEEWIRSRIKNGQYATDSDYVADLIRKDQLASQSRDEINEALIDAELSGISDRSIDEIWLDAKTLYQTKNV